jgi:hypothetical protein
MQQEVERHPANYQAQINQLVADDQSAKNRQQTVERLQLAFNQLEQQKDYLRRQMEEARKALEYRNYRYSPLTDSDRQQMEFLRIQLHDIDRQEHEVALELKHADEKRISP